MEPAVAYPDPTLALAQSISDITMPEVISASDWLASDPPECEPVICDVLDLGDKMAIISMSKNRKSFLVLQMAIAMAAGSDFPGLGTLPRRRVLVVQYELKAGHCHQRFKRMQKAMGTPDVGDCLFFVNARSQPDMTLDHVTAIMVENTIEVVIFDPLYKMIEGNENASEDVKPLLADFDRIAESTGAAVVYVHHDPKGAASERDIRDRGAGSNVLSRDYDACLTLTPHRDEKDTAIMALLLRNYPPRDPTCIRFLDDRFVASSAKPVTGKPGKYDEMIARAYEDNPDASLNDVAALVDCDRSTVSRIKKRLKIPASSPSTSSDTGGVA